MFPSLRSMEKQWRKPQLVIVLMVFLQVFRADCISTPPTAGGIPCSDGAVASLNIRDPCNMEYQRCEGGSWHRSRCVGGVPKNGTGECVPYTAECPDPGVTERTFTSRSKRQVSAADNCLRSYICPPNLNSVFIYPDWTNGNCDSYIVCASGKLLVSSCMRDGYNYYNPGRLSCEEFASPTNICVKRRNTVFGS